MFAADVMTRPVMTVRTVTPCANAATLLVEHGFTAAPVTDDDGQLVGIVTEADLLPGRIAPDPRHGDPFQTARFRTRPPALVGQVMTTPVRSLQLGADVADAVRIMLDERIRCLPIVDGSVLVGVITRRDLLRAAITHDDDALGAEIIDNLSAFDRRDRWNVSVQAGVVDIVDSRDSAADRAEAERIAAAVPGVVHATVHFETINSPNTGKR